MRDLDSILTMAPVIPVLVIDRVEDALPIAEALVEGGLPVIEVTLRTAAGLEAIKIMSQVAGAVVGAGSVLNPRHYEEVIDAGAQFAVSPGLTGDLARAASAGSIPLLPGVASASEIMRAIDHGFSRLKFFPAETLGGPKALSALSAVFRQVRFCPTGGIKLETAPQWLALSAVLCVGGSWLVPSGVRVERAGISERARSAAALGQQAITPHDCAD